MNFLKKLAPFLATGLSLAGPYGAIASKLLAPILGVKPDAKSDGFALALANATPDQIAAIKKAEDDFAVQMKQLDIQTVEDMEKLANEDRASARNREVAVKDHTPEAGFYMITVGFFCTLLFVAIHGINPQVHDLIIAMLASLGAAWVAAVNYFYGSSKGQDAQGKALADIAKS